MYFTVFSSGRKALVMFCVFSSQPALFQPAKRVFSRAAPSGTPASSRWAPYFIRRPRSLSTYCFAVYATNTLRFFCAIFQSTEQQTLPIYHSVARRLNTLKVPLRRKFLLLFPPFRVPIHSSLHIQALYKLTDPGNKRPKTVENPSAITPTAK